MPSIDRRLLGLILGLAVGGGAAAAPDSEADALALPSGPPESTEPAKDWRLQLEGAWGRGRASLSGDTVALSRYSADFVYSTRLSAAWRLSLSDRFDRLHPADAGQDAGINSLREAYVGWQDAEAAWGLEAGRINLRQGPALGYNPTDFFRDGALRVSATVNPYLIREYRMGSVMLRAQRLWAGGSVSLALSPKLATEAAANGASIDLGATNNRDRALMTWGSKLSESANAQLHLYAERGGKPQVGASLTTLLGESLVAFGEATWGRGPSWLSRVSNTPQSEHSAARAAAGLTYTTSFKLSVSAEAEYNGFAINRSDWQALRANQPVLLSTYLYATTHAQELAGRSAVMLYATQKDLGLRQFDLTALVRRNQVDRSRLAWLEGRYHFASVDVAVQCLLYSGVPGSEYRASPYRRTVQMVASYYF